LLHRSKNRNFKKSRYVSYGGGGGSGGIIPGRRLALPITKTENPGNNTGKSKEKKVKPC
jgi:hypothetical protein